MGMSEGWVRWGEELKLEGRAEGRAEGERRFLFLTLTKRFGVVPDEIRQRIETADEKQLVRWFERALEVDSPYELGDG